MTSNKKPPFTVQQHNVIKPQKHSFWLGISTSPTRKMIGLWRNWYDSYKKRSLNPCISVRKKSTSFWFISRMGCRFIFSPKIRKAAALLEKKKFISFFFRYLYGGALFIIEMLTVVGILILKVRCLGLEKIDKYPLLAFLVLSILLAWLFAKWKKFKTKKNDDQNNNKHQNDNNDQNDNQYKFK